MTRIIDIEGIGPAFAEKLKAAGIDTAEELLAAGTTPGGRQDLEAKTGIESGKILEWVNHADLMRIKGVGSEYADLLEAAGVDTVKELATRNAANLFAKLEEVNAAKSLVRRTPTSADVEKWITEAKTLPPGISY